ncbi:hypothetical protein Pst134EA_020782 [Puccinia striiformis f. sp. tritici]|uniref:hypothetical protein n=1 Tax=Puccinia striiformis f. sp. tritici TaxID=168172 RepID=UPI0020088D12|nr:hypothetical protein Pst134EA_020782 [Puccinia striiformis f. sp. tritici]KAH9456872.1 hypothetical protein Pst134EA_020782 [Puccinia striiformis f. sp. tritici]
MADQSTATTTSTEAHEVKSVREQVEEMGVEKVHSPGLSSSKSKDLPASWDAYADLQLPYACFAPQTTTWSFAQSSEQADQGQESSNPIPARALAPPSTSIPPAFSLTSQQTQTNSVCPNKFPSSLDFFLKGKRNTTSLPDSSPELDQDSASLHKKPKLPPPTTTTPSSCPSPASSCAAIRSSPTSLRSSALEKFNNNPALQTPSMQSSTVTSFLCVHPPSSKASSAIADNGETDEQQPSSTLSPHPNKVVPVQSALVFSAFATATGFGDTGSSTTKPAIDWSNGQPLLFDHHNPSSSSSLLDTKPLDQITKFVQSEWGNAALSPTTTNTGIKRRTHLALDAGLADEDKHEGILATKGEDQLWRERGTGGLRLLQSKDEPIMRADAVLQVLLNVLIFNGFSDRPTQDMFLTFGSTVVLDLTSTSSTVTGGEEEAVGTGEGGSKTQFQQYLCRFGKPEARQEMMDSIKECLKNIHRFHNKSGPENHHHQDDDPESALDASDLV